jgi:hypothetical protein
MSWRLELRHCSAEPVKADFNLEWINYRNKLTSILCASQPKRIAPTMVQVDEIMMTDNNTGRMRVFDDLRQAIDAWESCGNEQPLTRWLQRELDGVGALYRLEISD